MLKVSGIWISPFEVESAIASHAAVLEVAVVGKADENGLIKPKAYVVTLDLRQNIHHRRFSFSSAGLIAESSHRQ